MKNEKTPNPRPDRVVNKPIPPQAAATEPVTKPEPKSRRTRILLVDDHPMMRAGMAQVLNKQSDLEVCWEASDASQALRWLAEGQPGLAIIDITLPGRSGIELIKDMLALRPTLPILVVTLHDESLYAERALRAGARGYLMKESGGAGLLEAVRQVLAGRTYVSPQLAARIVDTFCGRRPRHSNSPIEKLTDREFEIFRLIGQGKTAKQIAQDLHLSPKTVDVHRGRIKQKLGISDVTALVSRAARWVEAEQGGTS